MTRSFTALTITACLLIAGQVHATSPQPATPVSEQSPAAFELKGIAVGDDANATKAKLPDDDCETIADGTIEQCLVQETNFGGKPAERMDRIRDGKVARKRVVWVEKVERRVDNEE